MPDVVTSGRRVRFAVNDGRSEEHTLTWAHDKRGQGPTISLLHPFGIALLGLRTGESITFEASNQETSRLLVENVVADERQSSLPRAIDINAARYQPNLDCLARWEDHGGRPTSRRTVSSLWPARLLVRSSPYTLVILAVSAIIAGLALALIVGWADVTRDGTGNAAATDGGTQNTPDLQSINPPPDIPEPFMKSDQSSSSS